MIFSNNFTEMMADFTEGEKALNEVKDAGEELQMFEGFFEADVHGCVHLLENCKNADFAVGKPSVANSETLVARALLRTFGN